MFVCVFVCEFCVHLISVCSVYSSNSTCLCSSPLFFFGCVFCFLFLLFFPSLYFFGFFPFPSSSLYQRHHLRGRFFSSLTLFDLCLQHCIFCKPAAGVAANNLIFLQIIDASVQNDPNSQKEDHKLTL